jgi:hypothetical protein
MVGSGKVAAPRTPVLEVTGTAAVAPPIPGSVSGPTEAQGDLFLWTRLDKPRAYVGEQLVYTLEVYERLPFPNIQLRALPGFQDFWSEELPEGDHAHRDRRGRALPRAPRAASGLFPQRAGTLTISAAEVGVGMRRRVRGRATRSRSCRCRVEDRPADFSANNVGLYTIAAKVDRAKVKQGEPFTLTVTISGTGNIRVIDPGAWPELDGMRRYDPKVETRDGGHAASGASSIYQFLIIPERAGTLTIPPHRFSFFDPATARYQTVTSQPIEVVVLADAAAPAPSVGPHRLRRPPRGREVRDDGLLAPLITPDTVPRVTNDGSWLTPGRFAAGMVLAPAVLVAATGGRALWRRFGPDEARAPARPGPPVNASSSPRPSAAWPPAKASIRPSRSSCKPSRSRAPAPRDEGLPRRALLELLARRGVTAPDLERLGRLLDRCDAARFGAASEGPERAQGRPRRRARAAASVLADRAGGPCGRCSGGGCSRDGVAARAAGPARWQLLVVLAALVSAPARADVVDEAFARGNRAAEAGT